MSQCQGRETASTKVDRRTLQFLDDQAEQLGVSRAELLRLLIDHYHEAAAGNLRCPHCQNALRLDL